MLNDEIKKKTKKTQREKKKDQTCLFFLNGRAIYNPSQLKKEKAAQGDVLPVTAQNPATIVVAGDSKGGILRVKTYFSVHFT
jgi:hypothetical protein